jgi:hypothetical protein
VQKGYGKQQPKHHWEHLQEDALTVVISALLMTKNAHVADADGTGRRRKYEKEREKGFDRKGDGFIASSTISSTGTNLDSLQHQNPEGCQTNKPPQFQDHVVHSHDKPWHIRNIIQFNQQEKVLETFKG